MSSLNRDERQTLREIQMHVRTVALESQVLVEQLGTVDVYVHPSNPSPYLNCAMPHKGVAWVRREDLLDAFTGLERLGRLPRLAFLDALFPSAFQHQIGLMGLTLEDRREVMVYNPLYGPTLPDEVPLGQLPPQIEPPVSATLATTELELATWLRVFRAAYYNAESVRVNPEDIPPLVAAFTSGESLFVFSNYQKTPLGAARASLRPPTAEIEVVATAPLWHGMGQEDALVATITRAALEHGCDTIFTIAPPQEFVRMYRRLGFVEITDILTFWRTEEAPATSTDTAATVHSKENNQP
jgi:hypothetical protein